MHTAQQCAEFAADVKSQLADGNAVRQVRRVPRPASRTTQSRDDDRRHGRPAEAFQLTEDLAQTAGVAACDDVRDKT